jgi:hypothetical protein
MMLPWLWLPSLLGEDLGVGGEVLSAQADIVAERPKPRFQSPRRQMLQCAYGFAIMASSGRGGYDQKETLAHERGSPNLGRGV